MVSSLVLIFLLDHLPDHPHQTFNTSIPYDESQDSILRTQQCSIRIADPLAQIASKELGTLLIPDWRDNDHTYEQLLETNHTFDDSEKVQVEVERLVDNYVDENDGSIEYDHFIEDAFISPPLEVDEGSHKGHASFHLLSEPSDDTGDNNQNNVTNKGDSYNKKNFNSDNAICTSNSDTNSNTSEINFDHHYNDSDKYSSNSHIINDHFYINHADLNHSGDWLYSSDTQNTFENETKPIPPNNEKNTTDTQNLTSNYEVETKEPEQSAEEVSFPETVPYLVAIFESLTNVTAQTCGGTLVAPEWVLTAAGCVNVLGKLYNENGERTTYTIIVNAANPLLDGSAHNVTKILFHPQPSTGRLEKKPVLALMKIEPKVEIEAVQIDEKVNTAGVEVMVYGWILVKNDSGHDAMHAASFPAISLSKLQCRRLYDHHPDNDTLCLTTSFASNDTVSQMTSGGPVVYLTAAGPRLLALAATDSHAPLVTALLSAHAPWLSAILRNG